MVEILLDCSEGGQPTKAAEDSRTPKRWRAFSHATLSARFWSAAVLCRFGFFTRAWTESEIRFAMQQYCFKSFPRLHSPRIL